MTFDPSAPQNGSSPSIFPGQNQANMSRLQTLFSADHQFNLSAAANDGYHNLVHLTQQAPSGALAGIGRLYVKSVAGRIQAYYMDDSAQEYQITPTLPIRASVNFDGTGSVGAQVIRSQFNVSGVSKTATGEYVITFTNPMPDVNYMVQVTAMRTGSQNPCNPCIQSSSTYTDSIQVGQVNISVFGKADDFQNPIMCNVTIFSVS